LHSRRTGWDRDRDLNVAYEVVAGCRYYGTGRTRPRQVACAAVSPLALSDWPFSLRHWSCEAMLLYHSTAGKTREGLPALYFDPCAALKIIVCVVDGGPCWQRLSTTLLARIPPCQRDSVCTEFRLNSAVLTGSRLRSLAALVKQPDCRPTRNVICSPASLHPVYPYSASVPGWKRIYPERPSRFCWWRRYPCIY
jgi:hypothetical protein